MSHLKRSKTLAQKALWLMQLIPALSVATISQAASQLTPPDVAPRLYLHVEHASVLNVLNAATKQAHTNIAISPEASRVIAGIKLSVHINNQSVTDVLHACLETATNGRFGLDGSPSEGYHLLDYSLLFRGIDHPEHPRYVPPPSYTKRKVSLSLIGITGAEALRQLFRSVGGSYIAEGSLEGAVSVNFLDTPFESALEQLLASWQNLKGFGLVSMCHGGVYSIGRDPEMGWRNSNVTLQTYNAPLLEVLRSIFNQAGASYVLDTDMLRATRVSVDFRNTRLEEAVGIALKSAQLNPMPTLKNFRGIYSVWLEGIEKPPRSAIVTHLNVRLKGADLRYAIKALFVHMRANYTIDYGFDRMITCDFKEITGQAFLEYILKSTGHGATYRIEGGSVYNLSSARPDSP
jgi:type II secretory pathway component GspD/PulD (secretin)